MLLKEIKVKENTKHKEIDVEQVKILKEQYQKEVDEAEENKHILELIDCKWNYEKENQDIEIYIDEIDQKIKELQDFEEENKFKHKSMS